MSLFDRFLVGLAEFLEAIGLGKLAAEILLLAFMGWPEEKWTGPRDKVSL
jgi:hypothetical protein